MALSGVLSAAGSLVGSVGSALGSGVSTAAGGASSAVQSLASEIGEQVSAPDLDADVTQILPGTDVPELQPEYLQSQVQQVRTEVTEAAQQVATDPENYQQTLSELSTSIQQRADTVAGRVDRCGARAAGHLPPSTVGSWLRAHKWSNVRQLDAISRELLARLWAAGAGPPTWRRR